MALTDQNMTGVPSRNRVQFTKPVQTGNTGRVQPQTTAPGAIQMPTKSSYPAKPALSPIEQVPAQAPAQNNPINPAAQAATERGEIYNPIQPKGYTDPLVEAATAASNPTPSNVDRVRQLIGDMSDDEILQILNSLSDGTLRGRGSAPAQPAQPGTEDIIGGATAPTIR